MIVLGIETATSLCGVGLIDSKGFVADYRLLREYIHAEYLPVEIDRLFKDAGILPEDIDGIAVSVGPGSFTGLRIGLGVAKGLAFGLGKPLVAVPTMDGLMVNVPPLCEWACVFLIARKGEVYQGIYKWGHNCWEQVGSYGVVQEKDIGKELPDGNVLFLGEGAQCYQTIIQKRIRKARFLPQVYSLPSGYNIAEKGREFLQAGKVEDLDSLVPLYLKRFQGIA